MKKTVFAIFTAALMMLSLCACNVKEGSDNNEETNVVENIDAISDAATTVEQENRVMDLWAMLESITEELQTATDSTWKAELIKRYHDTEDQLRKLIEENPNLIQKYPELKQFSAQQE